MNFNFSFKSAKDLFVFTELEIMAISEEISDISLSPLAKPNESTNFHYKGINDDFQRKNNYSNETWLILISSSYIVSGFLKHFLQSIAEESGKDFWKYFKKLITKIWNKQDEKIYRNHGFAYLLFPVGNHFVAFKFRKPHGTQNEIIDYYPILQEDILCIYNNLDKIESLFSNFLDKDLKQEVIVEAEFSKNTFIDSTLTSFVYIIEGFKSNHLEVTRQEYNEFLASKS